MDVSLNSNAILDYEELLTTLWILLGRLQEVKFESFSTVAVVVK
jgi:hypothetical protein